MLYLIAGAVSLVTGVMVFFFAPIDFKGAKKMWTDKYTGSIAHALFVASCWILGFIFCGKYFFHLFKG